jgi:photosystem II stability/assembly factor-like uncharacterized protein
MSALAPSTPYATYLPPGTPTASIRTPAATHEPTAEGFRVFDLHMVDDQQGWAVFKHGDIDYWLGRTTDGANTWRNVTPPGYEAERSKAIAGVVEMGILTIRPLDPEMAWAYTTCPSIFCKNLTPAIWSTEDGGHSWRSLDVPLDCDTELSHCVPDRVQFVDRQHGWLFMAQVSRNATTYLLYRSMNGGEMWEQLPAPPEWRSGFAAPLTPVFFDETFGLRLPPERAIPPPDAYAFESADKVLAGSPPTVGITRDGGTTWGETSLVPPAGLMEAVTAQASADDDRLWIHYVPGATSTDPTLAILSATYSFGWQKPDIFQATYFSSDRGLSWHSLSAVGDTFFVNAKAGWRLSSTTPVVLERTKDGGASWQRLATEPWAVKVEGGKSQIIHTPDGNAQPVTIDPLFIDDRLWSGRGVRLTELHMQTTDQGWGVEIGGSMLCTEDGAMTWQPCQPLQVATPPEAQMPQTKGVWWPQEPLPDELFHGQPVPAGLQSWIEHGLQFVPYIPENIPLANPFTYECSTEGVHPTGGGRTSVSRQCAIRFPTAVGTVYSFLTSTWYSRYSVVFQGTESQVWPNVVSVDYVDKQTGYRLLDSQSGDFRVERTEDGGQTWTAAKTMVWLGQLEFASRDQGWAIAREPRQQAFPTDVYYPNIDYPEAFRPSALLHTADGGRTWKEIQPAIR